MMMFQAFIDEVTADGRIAGWACRPGHVERLHVAVFYNGAVAAEAVTGDYRPDLLAAGLGLGYCAFRARLKLRPDPGVRAFDVALPGQATDMRRFIVTVPPPAPAPPPELPATPAAPAPGWTDEEVLENLACLRLEEQVAALGPDGFTDAVFQFVLRRWPEPEMTEAVRRAHAARAFDPAAFLREVLLCDERRGAADSPLPTPFDYRFPFRYPVAAAA